MGIPFRVYDTQIPGCLVLAPQVHADQRGRFVKVFHSQAFAQLGLRSDFVESYYSCSHCGVLRGLHFQEPPFSHDKIVYCVKGAIFDVVVDLRVGSPAFGKSHTRELNHETCEIMYIPIGCAHGFYVLSDEAITVYNTTTVYSPDHDAGIRWDSAGVHWPGRDPILSARDASFPKITEYRSPFLYSES